MRRFQNRVAESTMALPAALAYSAAVFHLCGLYGRGLWVQAVAVLAAALAVARLNNAYSLIRIYSRMVSCLFLLLTMAACHGLGDMGAAAASLCFPCFLLFLFGTYQDKDSAGMAFYAFAMLGFGSLAEPHMLVLLPLGWLLLATAMQALSLRTLAASAMGALLPWWFAAAWTAVVGDMGFLLSAYGSLSALPGMPDYSCISVGDAAVWCFSTLLLLVGVVHFLRQAHRDKIRTRSMYEALMVSAGYILAVAALMPQHSHWLIRAYFVPVAALAGHFTALTATKATNIATITMLAGLLALAAYNMNGIWRIF